MSLLRMFALVGVCACVLAQYDNSTAPPQQPQFPFPFFPFFPWGQQAGGAGGDVMQAVARVQMEQQMTHVYTSFLLEMQFNMGLMTVSRGYTTLSAVEMKNSGDFEENQQSRQLEQAATRNLNLEEFDQDDYDKMELMTEQQLLFVTKLMMVRHAKKFDITYKNHYRTKMQMMMLQSLGQGNPSLSMVVYLMYYRDMLATLDMSMGLQRHNDWNLWLFEELMETIEYQNSRIDLPDDLQATLVTSRAYAMNTYHMQAMLELQGTMIDYYLQMIFSQLGGAQVAAQMRGSFLEEEVEEGAEPSKPFLPMMMMGNPMMMYYYSTMLKFSSAYTNYYAAHSLMMAANHDLVDLNDDGELNGSNGGGVSSVHLNLHGWMMVGQHAYIALIKSYIELMGMYSGGGMGGGSPQQAMFSDLLQTDEPELKADDILQPVDNNAEQDPVEQPEQPAQAQLETATPQLETPPSIATAIPAAVVPSVVG